MNEVMLAFGLTLFAGMATGIGSIIAFSAKRTNYRFLSIATGFSAGVMLYVSFVEIFYKGVESLTGRYGDYWGHWINAASFFGGMLLIGVIDNLIPAAENPHEIHA
jgi:ZIP family zinc transporter